jgi:hypothetical protein
MGLSFIRIFPLPTLSQGFITSAVTLAKKSSTKSLVVGSALARPNSMSFFFAGTMSDFGVGHYELQQTPKFIAIFQ